MAPADYISALVRRLHSSDEAAQLRAAEALRQPTNSDPTLCQVAAAAGAAPALLQLLRSSQQGDLQRAALIALQGLIIHQPQSVVAAGGIHALVDLLSRTSDAFRATVALLLCFLTRDLEETCVAAVTAGAVPILLHSLRSELHASKENAVAAVAALAHLAAVPNGRQAILAAGGVPALVQCLHQPSLEYEALRALSHLSHDPAFRQAALAAGAAQPLARLVHAASADVAEGAAVLLAQMAASGPQGSETVASTGALPDAVRVLPQASTPELRQMVSAEPLVTLAEAATPQPTAQPAARPRRICAALDCGATSGLRRCAGCGTVRYCSVACSRAHWRAHRTDCRRLQAERAAAAAEAPAPS